MIGLILLIGLLIVLAWAAFTFLPPPVSWIIAGLIILIALLILVNGVDATCTGRRC